MYTSPRGGRKGVRGARGKVCKPVETGDRQTKDVSRSGRSDENVIRLPRDWLGPLEDLVPIGPAADARRAADEPYAEEAPPTADAFWTEDSAALHTAVQAPAGLTREPPSSSNRSGRRRRRMRVPAVQRTLPLRWVRPPSRRAWVAAVAVAALFLAAVGTIERDGRGVVAGPDATGTHHSGRDVAVVGTNSAANRNVAITLSRTSRQAGDVGRHDQRETTSQRNIRRIQGIKHRHPASDPGRTYARHTPSTDVESVSEVTTAASSAPQTYVPPTTTPSSAVTPAANSSGSAGSTQSGGHSAAQPAFGADGALGPGSSPSS
jgi:hypothetical protein